MCRFNKILIIAVAVALLTLSLAMAGNKFDNVDTAKNRKDNSFGTDRTEETGTTDFDKNDDGDTTIKTKARPKPEEVDWYDKIIITVNPTTRWPQEGSSTTTQTRYDNATDTQTTTTTTEEIN